MATNFIVILFQRQHFGNEQGTFNHIEPNVPFVGPTKDFSFNCPNVDPSETAFLMFQSRDVDHQRNVFQINGVDVFGGLPASPDRNTWNGNILLIEPRHQLRATGNVLHVESRNASGGSGGNIDDFIIDNVVIVYKIRVDGILDSASQPFVDLRRSPYRIVANVSTLAQRQANTAGIKQAIADHSGTNARLVLPQGRIHFEEDTAQWCIKFGTGVSKLTLAGQGMFGTTCVQNCVGDLGELNLFVLDGCQDIELCDFGVEQDTITNPDPGQQNHLICVYNNTLGGITKNVRGHNLYFGKCIGDAIRILANASTDKVNNVRFDHFMMVLNGVVASTPSNGRTGARSGIAIQRGGVDVTFSNFYIRGAQNSAIDEEPSGGAGLRVTYRDFFIDNTISNTAVAVSLGGTGTTVAEDGRVSRGHILGGMMTMLGSTDGCKVEDITIETTAAMPGAPLDPLLLIRSAGGGAGHVDLELNNITLKRTGTSAAGNGLDLLNTANRTTIRGLHVVQGVTGDPLLVEAAGRVDISGVKLQYDGAAPTSRFGVSVAPPSGTGTLNDLRISDVSIVSSTGKFSAAVVLASRTGRPINKVQIRDVRSAGFATNGVYMTLQAGTFDLTPEISGIDNGTDVVWKQVDQGDNAITTLFPIISGNRGDIRTHVGDATPEGAVTAIQGCMCIRKNGDTTELLFKQTTTGNTGWVQITVP